MAVASVRGAITYKALVDALEDVSRACLDGLGGESEDTGDAVSIYLDALDRDPKLVVRALRANTSS